MDKKAIDLIKFIICYADERDIKLTTIRLVKFIYLADLYYARRSHGKTLTEFPWSFVYYGPYCSEVMNNIDFAASSGAIAFKEYESNYPDSKDYRLYSCPGGKTEEVENLFPLYLISELKAVIGKFGDDTAALLDYVYFSTEPMMEAKKGDLLDFSKAQSFEPTVGKIKVLPPDKIRLGRKYASLLAEKFKRGQKGLREESAVISKWKDETYYRALECLDGEDLPEVGLKGTAKIEE